MAARVLVVDDEVELMTVLCELLAEHGYETVGCASAEDALAVLHEREVDLLVTDLMMPGMDGITLLRRAQEAHPYLVGIVATGQGTIQTAVDAMKSGAFDYVLKPFKLSALLADAGARRRGRAAQARQRAAPRDDRDARRVPLGRGARAEDADHQPARRRPAPDPTTGEGDRPGAGPDPSARCQIVERQAGKMSRLVAQLLETSRLDAGQFMPHRSLVDLASLVAAAVEQAQGVTDRHEIVLAAPEHGPGVRRPPRASSRSSATCWTTRSSSARTAGGSRSRCRRRAPSRSGWRSAITGSGSRRRVDRSCSRATIRRTRRATVRGWGWGCTSAAASSSTMGARSGWSFPTDDGSRFIIDLPAGDGARRRRAGNRGRHERHQARAGGGRRREHP